MTFDSSTVKRQTSVNDILNEKIEQAIDAKQHQIRDVLTEIESNTRKTFQGHIDFHKFLMGEARKSGDMATAIRHQVLMETYEGILKNFTLSKAYDKV